MSDFTINVQSDGQEWVWSVALRNNSVVGVSRRITDVEDDARSVIVEAAPTMRYAGFTTEVVLANPYVRNHLPPAIICDIDGTLAERNNRGPYEMEKVETDDLNRVVAEVLEMYREDGHSIILLSGRQSEYRDHTVRWLEKHFVDYDALFMRATGDRRSDDIVKLQLFDNHVRGTYDVTLVLDDRDRCVYLWRKLGLACWQVNFGDF